MASPSKHHDVVVVGASAGGVEALISLVRELPEDLPAAVFVVLHVSPAGTSVLADILGRAGRLQAVKPSDGAVFESGCLYVAPADDHMLLGKGRIHLSRGPRENGHRPAIDPLFRSAAETYEGRVIGIVMSGARDDGTAGLDAIKRSGGVTIVQDPDEALYASMPMSALANVEIDWTLPAGEIGPLVTELARSDGRGTTSVDGDADEPEVPRDPHENEATGFTCPECGGAMWQVHEGRLVRFKCRVGHSYTLESMLEAQSQSLEAALWAARRGLEERRDLLRRMATRLRGREADHDGAVRTAEHFDQAAEEASARAELIERAIIGPKTARDAS